MRLADWDGAPEGPDGWPGLVPVRATDPDADGDGTADTVVAPRADGGAWVFTDLDADGWADHVLDVAAPDAEPSVLDVLVRLVTGRR